MMFVPMMSAGIRSGVNWMRLNFRSSTCASVRTRSVLPRPGTPFEQRVPADEQARQDAVDDVGVADDHLADLGLDVAEPLAELLGLFDDLRGHESPVGASEHTTPVIARRSYPFRAGRFSWPCSSLAR